ncbi:hypothetical protein GCM10017778_53040 [Streptomyces vinaceus]|nr:hypothetical protein GCM10017778_53040 [Streptomyces vinaceus]
MTWVLCAGSHRPRNGLTKRCYSNAFCNGILHLEDHDPAPTLIPGAETDPPAPSPRRRTHRPPP